MISKFENQISERFSWSKSKVIMTEICIDTFLVFSHTLPANPELCKKLWPVELYVIRMIFKKIYLVVILYKINSYRRLLNNRELSWGSRSIAWCYQLNLEGKLMTSLIN